VPPMNDQQNAVCERLKRMGYHRDKQIRMYGEEFELISDPISLGNYLFVVDAIERRSRQVRRVRIPLSVVNPLRQEQASSSRRA
jgi:hypothetical protein